MIYNLFLNSTTDNPLTNYFSTIATNPATDKGQRVYAIDWSFLPENKHFEVSFRFATKSAAFTADNLCYITSNIGPVSSSVSGGSIIQKRSNNILGVLKPRPASTTANDIQLSALVNDNDPIFLLGRPNNNLLEIRIISNTGSQFALSVDYILILSFKEVN